MAKSSGSGLGRGLNSLLGVRIDIPSESSISPQKESINSSTQSSQLKQKTIHGSIDKNNETSDHVVKKVEIGPSRLSEDKSNKEISLKQDVIKSHDAQVFDPVDNITIKEVSERIMDELPLEYIHPNPDQPRIAFNQNEINDLAASIKSEGLLQPILVRMIGKNNYQIIAGERRWQASKIAGLTVVPVKIKDVDDGTALKLAMIENLQRSNLNPIEEAYGYKRMMDVNSMTQAEVAEALSKGRSTITNALRLLDLPEIAQQLLFEDKITAGHARAILSIPSREGQNKLTEKLTKEKLSVREAEAYARLLSGKINAVKKEKEPIPKVYRTAARELQGVLNSKVKIRSINGKNKVEIEFKDEADLERIFHIISKENNIK